jgi:hypothetical protein
LAFLVLATADEARSFAVFDDFAFDLRAALAIAGSIWKEIAGGSEANEWPSGAQASWFHLSRRIPGLTASARASPSTIRSKSRDGIPPSVLYQKMTDLHSITVGSKGDGT